MSSDAMGQFAELFNQWVLDHGISNYHGGGFKKGVGNADVDLPMLESGIHDLIAEAKAMVAADAISVIGEVLPELARPDYVITRAASCRRQLAGLRDELAEIADGHAVEPDASPSGYRHENEDRIGHKDWADGAAMDEARASGRDWPIRSAPAPAYPPDAGSRRVLQHVLGDLQRRVARLEARQRPIGAAPDDDSLMGPSL